jgi:ABC-type nitrate/sulfonate/bicarbonate transport system substrate-binding protein
MVRTFRLPLFTISALASALVLSMPSQAAAQEKTKLTINSFKSATLWPIFAAKTQGFFEREGIDLDSSYTRSSKAQMSGLVEGKFDMVTTALDNVIAYSEGEGAPGTPKNGDLVAILGGNTGLLSLISQPQYKTVKDLKGTDIAVDALSTGYSFVLFEILAKSGLKPGDYKLTAVGGTGARLQSLMKKQHSAALLTPPLSFIAMAGGLNNVADARDVLGGYQGSVSATRRDWAKQNGDLIVRYIRAYRAGQEWLMNPANKDAAMAILVAEFPRTKPALAQATYKLLVTDNKGYNPGAKLDMAGAKNVLDLRRRYGPKGKTIADVGHFIDESYFNQAVK